MQIVSHTEVSERAAEESIHELYFTQKRQLVVQKFVCFPVCPRVFALSTPAVVTEETSASAGDLLPVETFTVSFESSITDRRS